VLADCRDDGIVGHLRLGLVELRVEHLVGLPRGPVLGVELRQRAIEVIDAGGEVDHASGYTGGSGELDLLYVPATDHPQRSEAVPTLPRRLGRRADPGSMDADGELDSGKPKGRENLRYASECGTRKRTCALPNCGRPSGPASLRMGNVARMRGWFASAAEIGRVERLTALAFALLAAVGGAVQGAGGSPTGLVVIAIGVLGAFVVLTLGVLKVQAERREEREAMWLRPPARIRDVAAPGSTCLAWKLNRPKHLQRRD
jgi:hypothetical protein